MKLPKKFKDVVEKSRTRVDPTRQQSNLRLIDFQKSDVQTHPGCHGTQGRDCLIVNISNNEPELFMTMSAEGVLGIIQDVVSNDPDEVAINFEF